MGNTAASKKDGSSGKDSGIKVCELVNKCQFSFLVAVQAYLTQAKEEFHRRWESPSKSVSFVRWERQT